MLVAERLPEVALPEIRGTAEVGEAYLEDASGYPPGRAVGVARVSDEAEAAALLRATRERGLKILPQAGRSSVTGGAVPRGELVLSVERMARLERLERAPERAQATFGPGIRLRELQRRLAEVELYYPPVPTYGEAMLGGTVATNAGGAATFKYGVTRDWVRGLRVLLFNGDRLTLTRGEATARPGESFAIRLSDGVEIAVPAPTYTLPPLKKISAGYFAADPLDLVDLFVGSEGTLGLITAITVDLVALPPAVVTGWVCLPDESAAFDLAAQLRTASLAARRDRDPRGPDVRAIEWLDAASLEILRRHGDARSRRVEIPAAAGSALLFEMELEQPTDAAGAQDLLADYLDPQLQPVDCGLVRLFRLLDERALLDSLELAFPGDARRHAALSELREAVPQRVGEQLARRRRIDPAVAKVGGDLIVPFDRIPELVTRCREELEGRGLEHAIWGHLGDGNLHPNVLPHSAEDVAGGHEALKALARTAGSLGGCPLSEHGVGRNPVKQAILQQFLGPGAIDEMRRIKRALDPEARFAPGVLLS